jgi:beta-aspartyl-peptidase (threonine type)
MNRYSLAIHGGAGTIRQRDLSPEQERAYRAALLAALQAGELLLQEGSSALAAVEAAVSSLEDCPLFNAGRGAVYNHDGIQEMDAAMMCGKTLQAGAVGLIRGIRNPIRMAARVLEVSEHVFLCGDAALEFAREQGIAMAAPDYFHSAERFHQLEEARAANRIQLDHADDKFGTVGAVALDMHGHLAAATSTGGVTNKRYGRIGDSPLIGSGTYANDRTCAVSCTGYGEYFIRGVVAYDVSCLMEYAGLNLAEACRRVIREKQVQLGGEGGLIAVDAQGNTCLEFNSEGMYRGRVRQGQQAEVRIFGD